MSTNSFAGKLFTGSLPWTEIPENPKVAHDRNYREYVGDIIRKRVTKGVLCLKKDVLQVIAALATDHVHLVVSAGTDYQGAPQTVDFGYGWKFMGVNESSHSPSFARLDFEYSRELPAALSMGLFPGLSIVETEGSASLVYSGFTLLQYTDTPPIADGLDFSFYVTKRTEGAGDTALTYFDAAAVLLFNGHAVETVTSNQADFTKDPLTGQDIVAGSPTLFNRLRKEIYWEYDAPTLNLMWWGKVWKTINLQVL